MKRQHALIEIEGTIPFKCKRGKNSTSLLYYARDQILSRLCRETVESSSLEILKPTSVLGSLLGWQGSEQGRLLYSVISRGPFQLLQFCNAISKSNLSNLDNCSTSTEGEQRVKENRSERLSLLTLKLTK